MTTNRTALNKFTTPLWLCLGLILWVLNACEFKFPTTPSLPERWDTKLILPFLDRTYSCSDLLYKSETVSNPIYADTTGNLYFTAGDSTIQPLQVNAATFWKVPAYSASKTVELRRTLRVRSDSTVIPLRYTLRAPISQADNQIIRGLLANSSAPTHNQLELIAILSDTFPNTIKVKLTCINFSNAATGKAVSDSLTCGVNSLTDTVLITLNGDSVTNSSNNFLDSLAFTLDIQVDGKLPLAPSRLTQSLQITLNGTPLWFDAFYGTVYAQGYVPGLSLINAPQGGADILFEDAFARLAVTAAATVYEKVFLQISGKKPYGSAASQDTLLLMPIDSAIVSLQHALSNLPDSLLFFLRTISKVGEFHQTDLLSDGVDAKYSVFLPLKFKLPAAVTLAAGKTSTYFIKDSTTRRNILTAQNGVLVDLNVENRTPLTGRLDLLISNFDIFPFDTLGGNLPTGFIMQNGKVYYVNQDTVLVKTDTLVTMELPQAVFNGSRLSLVGRSQQSFLADSETVALFADTCYLKPYFHLVNPEGKTATLHQSQSIRIRSFLNIFLDVTALKE